MNVEQVRRDLERRKRGGFWRPREGENHIRILPPLDPNEPFYHAVRLHWIGSRPVLCTQPECLVCEILSTGVIMGNTIRTIERFLVSIVDLDAPQDGVQIWPMPASVWADVARLIVEGKWGDITDPMYGRNLVIIREGTGIGTRYQVLPEPEVSQIDSSFLKDIPNLKTVYSAVEPSQLVEILRDEGIHVNITRLNAMAQSAGALQGREPNALQGQSQGQSAPQNQPQTNPVTAPVSQQQPQNVQPPQQSQPQPQPQPQPQSQQSQQQSVRDPAQLKQMLETLLGGD